MLMPRNDTEDTSQEVIARGLSLAGVSAEVPNSEGMVRYDVWLCDVFYFIFYMALMMISHIFCIFLLSDFQIITHTHIIK